jgi:transcriptional regulator with XRE-family HTH domain
MKEPATSIRRVRTRLNKPGNELVTMGEQMRMCRELRGLSKSEVAREIGCDSAAITRYEKGFLEGVSFRKLHKYMQAIGCTLIATPLPFPSYINHNVHKVQIYTPSYIPTHRNFVEE